jgi:hypothetical protein
MAGGLRLATALVLAAAALVMTPDQHGVVTREALAGEAGTSMFWTSWTLTSVTGQVSVQEDAEATPRPAEVGEIVADDGLVSTGPDSAATLQKGNDVVELRADTAVQLPAPSTEGVWTRVVQSVGEAFFEVETRPSRHFQVETPYLTALVKGTQFTIGIEDGEAEVAVSRGTVGVSAKTGGASADVTAGQTATVASARDGVAVAGSAGTHATASNDRGIAAAEGAATVEGSVGTDEGLAAAQSKAAPQGKAKAAARDKRAGGADHDRKIGKQATKTKQKKQKTAKGAKPGAGKAKKERNRRGRGWGDRHHDHDDGHDDGDDHDDDD